MSVAATLTTLALVSVCLIQVNKCDDVEYNLVHLLLDKYDPGIRPSINHNFSVNVTFGLALTQIIDVDERNMIVTTNCWLNQDWIDEHLKWKPSEHNNIRSVHIPIEKLWKPDILLVNNADSWASISTISTNLIVKNDGNVTWLSTVIFKSSCSINVRYFPFDEQVCDLIFASWTFDMLRLNIDVNSNEGDSTNYIKNGEWHLVKLTAVKRLKKYSCCEELYPEIVYTLTIRRRPLFYVFNMVFPCLLITLVAFLGFFLPPDSSEKVSIGITTLLSITVFLMLVAESMPPTSEELPLLGIYYAITICIVTFSTGFAVMTLNINNKGKKGDRRPPKTIRKFFFKYLAKFMRYELANAKNKYTNSLNFVREENQFTEESSIRLDDYEEFPSKTNNSVFVLRPSPSIRKSKNNSVNYPSSESSALTSSPSHDYNYKRFKQNEVNDMVLIQSDGKQKHDRLLTMEFVGELERVLNKQFDPLIKNLTRIQTDQDKQKCTTIRKEIIQNEWRDIAMISDQIISIVFSSITIIACVVIFSNSPHIFPLSEW